MVIEVTKPDWVDFLIVSVRIRCWGGSGDQERLPFALSLMHPILPFRSSWSASTIDRIRRRSQCPATLRP